MAFTNLSGDIAGDVAHDDVDSGNPVKIGGVARTANPTAISADGDRSDVMVDDLGRLVVVNSHVRDLVVKQYTAVSTGTETTILTAGGAGVFHDITTMILTSDKNNVDIIIRDSTAGSTVIATRMDQNSRVVFNFSPPLPQTTANNNWTVDLDTGSATLDVTVIAVKNV